MYDGRATLPRGLFYLAERDPKIASVINPEPGNRSTVGPRVVNIEQFLLDRSGCTVYGVNDVNGTVHERNIELEVRPHTYFPQSIRNSAIVLGRRLAGPAQLKPSPQA
jgi:hypothetical protein